MNDCSNDTHAARHCDAQLLPGHWPLMNLGTTRAADRVDAPEAPVENDEAARSDALRLAVLAAPNLSLVATNCAGVIGVFSVGAEHLFGYAASEVVGCLTIGALCDTCLTTERATALGLEPRLPVASDLERVAEKAPGAPAELYELTCIRKDGSRFPATLSTSVLRDPAGTPIGYAFVCTDNTALRLAEEGQVEGARLEANARFDNLLELHLLHLDTRALYERVVVEQKISERLLLNVLPESIARRLNGRPELTGGGFDAVIADR